MVSGGLYFTNSYKGYKDEDEELDSLALISVRLKRTRLRAGLSVAEVSELSGINRQHIYKLESGKSINITTKTLQRLTNAYGHIVTLNFFPGDVLEGEEGEEEREE